MRPFELLPGWDEGSCQPKTKPGERPCCQPFVLPLLHRSPHSLPCCPFLPDKPLSTVHCRFLWLYFDPRMALPFCKHACAAAATSAARSPREQLKQPVPGFVWAVLLPSFFSGGRNGSPSSSQGGSMITRSVKRCKWPQWERREGFSVALVLVARKQAFASAAKYALAEKFWLGASSGLYKYAFLFLNLLQEFLTSSLPLDHDPSRLTVALSHKEAIKSTNLYTIRVPLQNVKLRRFSKSLFGPAYIYYTTSRFLG